MACGFCSIKKLYSERASICSRSQLINLGESAFPEGYFRSVISYKFYSKMIKHISILDLIITSRLSKYNFHLPTNLEFNTQLKFEEIQPINQYLELNMVPIYFLIYMNRFTLMDIFCKLLRNILQGIFKENWLETFSTQGFSFIPCRSSILRQKHHMRIFNFFILTEKGSFFHFILDWKNWK